MLSLSQSLRVFVCTRPTDMRRSFDGLYTMAEQLMKQDPLSGHLFVFRNRNRDRLKLSVAVCGWSNLAGWLAGSVIG